MSVIYRTLSRNHPHVRYEHESGPWCQRCGKGRWRWVASMVKMGKKHQRRERHNEAREHKAKQ